PSTVNWVAVVACTVVISPSSMPNSSCSTLANGAKQLVVQEALEMIVSDAFTSWWFTPITNIGASLEGAEITTFLAPPSMWYWAVSKVVKIPVHSATISAPTSSHFRFLGSRSAVILMVFPLTTRFPSFTSIVPSNFPCTESYSNKYARCSTSNKSLIATTSTLSLFTVALKTNLPILPNPLIPIFKFDISTFFVFILCCHYIGNPYELFVNFCVGLDSFFYGCENHFGVLD